MAASTSELVDEVIAAMEAAGAGDPNAEEKLAEKIDPKAKKPAEPDVAEVAGLTADDRKIRRPNGEWYIVRKMGDHDDVKVLQTARDSRMPVLLYGVPGTGKTALFEAAFTETGFRYVPGSGDTEVADFIGGYVPLPGGDFRWVDGPLIEAMEQGLPLLIDEIALIDPKVMALVYSLMDGRAELNVTANPERGVVKSADGFWIAGACNPNAPGARMSEALVSRFLIHAEVGVDFALVKKMGVPQRFVTAVQNIKKKYDEGQISWYPAIRECLGYKRVAELFGDTTALRNIISQAPEIDRAQVTDILSRAYGMNITTLEIK